MAVKKVPRVVVHDVLNDDLADGRVFAVGSGRYRAVSLVNFLSKNGRKIACKKQKNKGEKCLFEGINRVFGVGSHGS